MQPTAERAHGRALQCRPILLAVSAYVGRQRVVRGSGLQGSPILRVDGAGVLEALEAACAPETPEALAALRRALRDLRVTRAPADAARLFEAAGRPRAVSCAARRALRGSLAAAVALMLLAGGAELAFPSRGAQFHSLDEL